MQSPAFIQGMGFRRLLSQNISHPLTFSTQQMRPRQLTTLASATAGKRSRRLCSSTAAPDSVHVDFIVKNSALKQVEGILQHTFTDRSLLAQAMTHRSVMNPGLDKVAAFEDDDCGLVTIKHNNERLELLGDRVFGLLVAQALYEQDMLNSEGQMSSISHSLVSRKKAHNYCKTLGLNQYLLESKKMLQGQKGARYGDFFEALLGALFVDGGYDAALQFFRSKVVPIWEDTELRPDKSNCQKQQLQEYLVSQGLPVTALGTQLKYVQLKADFHQQIFTQSVELFGRRLSTASGPTRRSADQAAAEMLLRNLKRIKTTCLLIRMARQANDHDSLSKLQATRNAQVRGDKNEPSCNTAAHPTSE